MAEVVVLTDESLEGAEPVGVPGLAVSTWMWKSRLRWARWRSNAGTSSGYGQTTKDLVHGEKAVVVTEHRVDGVVGGAGLLD